MIVYKWVIKEKDFYKPIINNGAYRPANSLHLKNYKKGKTINNFIDVDNLLNIKRRCSSIFHKPGFHFWKNPTLSDFNNFQRCMQHNRNQKINCTLRCYIRQKDIILENDNKIIAKKFRILGEA